MLRSLDIRNYRNLRHLTIEKLGRVNLLVGKNNTGKTLVLEAIYLWANNGRFDVIYEVLFMRQLIHQENKLQPEVDAAIDALQAKGLQLFTDVHRPKAFIHTWLAWQKDPGTPMGLALTKTYLDHNADLCRRFVSWLNLLFNTH